MNYNTPTTALLSIALLLFAPLGVFGACPADKPWEIALTGDADYECDVTGLGWTTGCGKGKSICVTGNNDHTLPGGAIHLFAPEADHDIAGTLIECTFVNPIGNPQKNAASNCDISNVDGYNFDVSCTGTISLGYTVGTDTDKGDIPSPWDQTCKDLAPAAGVCKNPNGKDISTVEEAPAFFHTMGKTKGVYVAAHQDGVPVAFSNDATGGKITCDVSGGMPSNLAKTIVSDVAVERRDGVEETEQLAESPMEKRLATAGHSHARGHAKGAARTHARSLHNVVMGS